MTLNLKKPVVLELHGDTYPARILATDAKGNRPIIAVYEDRNLEIPISVREDGTTTIEGFRLVNIPEIRYEYQNVYVKGRVTHSYRYKQFENLEMKGGARMGYLKYTFEGDELKSVEFIRD